MRKQEVPKQRFSPGGQSAYDKIMREAKILFPQPVAPPPSTNWPWAGELERLMKSAPDLSPEAVAAARIEIARARQTQLQGWLSDRTAIFRSRGLDAHLVGVDFMELVCRACGTSWLLPAGQMPDDSALCCPAGCGRI